jgi:hypothetical protein
MQKFIGMLTVHHRGDYGIFAATSGYAAPAEALARQHGVVLWSGDDLARMVAARRSAPAAPARRTPVAIGAAATVLLVGGASVGADARGAPATAPAASPTATSPSGAPTPTTVVSVRTVIAAPTPPRPTATVTRAPDPPTATGAPRARVAVANTGGVGVYLRRSPRMDDRLSAWPDNTSLDVLREERVQGDGEEWIQVRSPDGQDGYVPVRYVTTAPP